MTSAHPERRQKIKHELTEMLTIFLYLAVLFCAVETFELFLLDEYHVRYWGYTFASINALVITKVIMIGEYAKLGKRHEDRALLVSAIWKAFVFSLLVFAFHIVEEIIKRRIHGADLATASRELRLDQFAARTIVVFCTFIPLFAFREFRRVMGEEGFRSLVFGSGGRSELRHPA
jgi:heme exporter protein D